MKIRVQDLVTNPTISFWVIVISIITLIVWASVTFKNRHTASKDEIKRDTHTLLMMALTIIFITGFHYWSMGQQGLQTIFVNPYRAMKAANLAPSVTQITSAEKLNNLSDEQKEKTIVIVFKFGCPDCQRLWLYAQEHPELLPSENVLWVSNKKANKETSTIVASSEHYPSITYWKKQNESSTKANLIEQKIEEPTEAQLQMLQKLAKEYKK